MCCIVLRGTNPSTLLFFCFFAPHRQPIAVHKVALYSSQFCSSPSDSFMPCSIPAPVEISACPTTTVRTPRVTTPAAFCAAAVSIWEPVQRQYCVHIVSSQWQCTIDYKNTTQYIYNRQWNTITIHNDIEQQYTMTYNNNKKRITITIHNEIQ